MRIVDLHCHTTCSDGELSPIELLEMAKRRGVTDLAITDHDTLDAYAILHAKAAIPEFSLYSGIELSCQWNGRSIHIVGLGFDLASRVIKDACNQQKRLRLKRAELLADRLERAGLPNLLSEAVDLAPSGVPGRPHFAQAMIKRAIVSRIDMAFKQYLGDKKLGNLNTVWPEVATAVRWIQESGGVAVIAHPLKYDMTRTKLLRLIDTFIDSGGAAIECWTSGQDSSKTLDLVRIAREKNMLVSVGSDFHGPTMPWAELGRTIRLPTADQCRVVLDEIFPIS